MITYKLLGEHKQDPLLGEYTTYGIAVLQEETTIKTIEDITLDRGKIEALIRAFEQEQLSLSQLEEAVENFLYDFEV